MEFWKRLSQTVLHSLSQRNSRNFLKMLWSIMRHCPHITPSQTDMPKMLENKFNASFIARLINSYEQLTWRSGQRLCFCFKTHQKTSRSTSAKIFFRRFLRDGIPTKLDQYLPKNHEAVLRFQEDVESYCLQIENLKMSGSSEKVIEL